MKVVIDLLRDSFANPADALDFGKPGAGNGAGRAEMVQQGLLAASADPGDFVKRRAPKRFGVPGAIRADRETVRFVAQPLQEIEHRIARFQRERSAPRNKEPLAA